VRYERKPKSERTYYHAALYRPGAPLSELEDVALKSGEDVIVAEVPEMRVLLVQYLNTFGGDYPAKIDYVVVEEGDYLVYSERYSVLYAEDAENFERQHAIGEES